MCLQGYSLIFQTLSEVSNGIPPKSELNSIGHEPEGRMLPTSREFCRHIKSERTTQAASNKRRLHPVSGGITL